MSGLGLVVLFFYIFEPIVFGRMYKSEIQQEDIRYAYADYFDDDVILVDDSKDSFNFTVREALLSTFNNN